MKFFIKITLAFVILSAIVAGGYFFYLMQAEKQNPAIMIIDGRKVRASEFREFRIDGKPCESVEKCLEKFLEMQAFVSEGIRMKLDSDESLKNISSGAFNEKLSAMVLEKAGTLLDSSPSKDDIENYFKLYKGKVTFSTYIYEDLESAKSGGDPAGKTRTVSFEKLSGQKAFMLGTLEPGSKTMPFRTPEGYEILQLDIMEQDLSVMGKIPDNDRKLITEKIEKDKKQYLFEKWKHDSRQKAVITFTENFRTFKF